MNIPTLAQGAATSAAEPTVATPRAPIHRRPLGTTLAQRIAADRAAIQPSLMTLTSRAKYWEHAD